MDAVMWLPKVCPPGPRKVPCRELLAQCIVWKMLWRAQCRVCAAVEVCQQWQHLGLPAVTCNALMTQMHYLVYEDGEHEWVCLRKEAHLWRPP